MSQRPIPYYKTYSRLDPIGAAAPPFNPSKPIKTWVEPNPTWDLYLIVKPDHSGFDTLSVTPADAKVLNLVGHPAYQPYVAVPCLGTFFGGPFPLGVADYLDAQALIGAFGLTNADITDQLASFGNMANQVDYRGDTRRAWVIKGVLVADYLKQKNAAGIGAPGEWDLSGSVPVWKSTLVPDSAAAGDTTLPVPILGPVDPLEKIVGVGPLGVDYVLVMPDPPVPAPVTGTGGGLLPDERAALMEVLAWVKKVGG